MPGGSGQASEVYDPALRVWEQSPVEDRNPAMPLVNVHAASDGTVFIRYGTISQASKAPPPPAASHDPGRTDLVLRDGRALLAGGGSPSFPYDSPNRVFSDAAIYDPVRDQWTVVEPLRVARADAIAIELADGRVLVVGGRTIAGRLNSAELLDPRTGRWTSAGTLGPL